MTITKRTIEDGKRPDKTFGLQSSTELYLNLLCDIDRLKNVLGSKPVQYAS